MNQEGLENQIGDAQYIKMVAVQGSSSASTPQGQRINITHSLTKYNTLLDMYHVTKEISH